MTTKTDDVVLDLFVGGGSSLSMAEKHGRYWVGCEISSTTYARMRILKEPKARKRVRVPAKINRLFK
jgi:DNA modification methylase